MELTQEDVNELFYKEYSSLFSRLISVVKNPADAEDLVQDAYIKMTEKTFEGYQIQYPRAFLYQMAHNLAIDFLRKKKRENNYELDSDHIDGRIDEFENTAFEQVHRPPEYKLDTERTLANVFNSLNTLPGKCQEAFVRHKFHQLSYRETASEMGISVSMVEKYLSKALKHVRKIDMDLPQAA